MRPARRCWQPGFAVAAVVSTLSAGSRRAKVFLTALLVAGTALGKALGFLCLPSAVLAREQEPQGLHLPVVISLGNLFCLRSPQ